MLDFLGAVWVGPRYRPRRRPARPPLGARLAARDAATREALGEDGYRRRRKINKRILWIVLPLIIGLVILL
jgi:hypothetical protein